MMLKLAIILPALLVLATGNPETRQEAFFRQLLTHSIHNPGMAQMIVPSSDSSTSCEIELHVTENIKGQCIQLGSTNDRGCMAGMYFEPFHVQCMDN